MLVKFLTLSDAQSGDWLIDWVSLTSHQTHYKQGGKRGIQSDE